MHSFILLVCKKCICWIFLDEISAGSSQSPWIKTWHVSPYPLGLAQFLGTERGIKFTSGECEWMNDHWYLLIPSDNQRKCPDLKLFISEHFLESLERDMFWNWWLKKIQIFAEFLLFLLLLFFFYHELSRVFLDALFISSNSKEGHIMCTLSTTWGLSLK